MKTIIFFIALFIASIAHSDMGMDMDGMGMDGGGSPIFYVDAANDGGTEDGITPATAYGKLQDVFDSEDLDGGETILLLSDISETSVVWGSNDGGAVGNPVVLNTNGKIVTLAGAVGLEISAVDHILIMGGGTIGGTATTATIRVTNSADSDVELDVTLYNLTVSAGADGAHGLRNNASDVDILGCTFTGFATTGDAINTEGEIEVANCTITNQGEGDGIQLINSGDGSSGYIHDNTITVEGSTKSPITANVRADVGASMIIENNVLTGGPVGIEMGFDSAIIAYNKIVDSAIGIRTDAPDIEIVSNIITHSSTGTAGIVLFGSDPYCTDAIIVNNTIDGTWTTAGIRLEASTSAALIANNIITGGTRNLSANASAVITAMYNNDYPDGDGNGYWLYGGTAYDTLAAFQTGESLDANSLLLDPSLDGAYVPSDQVGCSGSISAGVQSALSGYTDYAGNAFTLVDGYMPIGAMTGASCPYGPTGIDYDGTWSVYTDTWSQYTETWQ